MSVATPPNDDSKMLFRLLADRQWHSYWVIRDAIAKTVAPGRALRKYQEGIDFRRRVKYQGDPDYDSRLTEDERMALGARNCAQVCISSWKRAGALMQRGEGRDKEIRVRPDFRSPAFPGYEPASAAADRPSEGVTPTDLPVEGSEPSEGELSGPQEASGERPVAAVALDGEEVRAFVRPDPDGDWIRAEDMPPPAALDDPASLSGGVVVPVDSPLHCEVCGLAVGDRGAHTRWHEDLVKAESRAELSLLDESQLRDLLRSTLIDVLDEFQQGMQEWIGARFAELEGRIHGLERRSWKLSYADD